VEPQPAYPWELELRIEYALSGRGLDVTVEAMNVSADVAPFGIGFHPYLTVGTNVVDEAELTVPASRRLLMNERELPTGAVDVDGTDVDFRHQRMIGPTRMDTAFSHLRRDARGRARVRLERTDGLRALDLWMEREFRYVMVYTGDALESVERRRKAVAVEPMTCPPNAFHTGTDVIRLTPGVSWRAGWGIDPCPTEGTTS
jgi:galactose mutarotase-like enzyme